jgi:hypothetical protein
VRAVRYEQDEIKARQCASQIERYWREQGYLVNAWAEKIQVPRVLDRSNASGTHWVVRSDLVNGHPVRKLES